MTTNFRSAYCQRTFNFERPLDFTTLEDLVHEARDQEVPSGARVTFPITGKHGQIVFTWEVDNRG